VHFTNRHDSNLTESGPFSTLVIRIGREYAGEAQEAATINPDRFPPPPPPKKRKKAPGGSKANCSNVAGMFSLAVSFLFGDIE